MVTAGIALEVVAVVAVVLGIDALAKASEDERGADGHDVDHDVGNDGADGQDRACRR